MQELAEEFKELFRNPRPDLALPRAGGAVLRLRVCPLWLGKLV